MEPAFRVQLYGCLREAQRIGAVGPGSLDDQLTQSLGFAAGPTFGLTGRVIDLGSGGGLPALPLACAWPDSTWLLVESWTRRAALLRRFVRELALASRVVVTSERAELVGHGAERGNADVVTARSFGPAAVTLECAAPHLTAGGRVLISVRASDPPWPSERLDAVGLAFETEWRIERFVYRSLISTGVCPGAFPRRPGVPERLPLF